jgi:hypothetical protein
MTMKLVKRFGKACFDDQMDLEKGDENEECHLLGCGAV